MASLNNCYSKNFNTFIENILKKEPGYLTNLYARYIHSDKVSFIGKQENLAKDLTDEQRCSTVCRFRARGYYESERESGWAWRIHRLFGG